MAHPTPPARRDNLIVLGGVCLVLVLLIQIKPINDVDIFWQVKLGQLMIDTGGLVEHDVFTFTHPGAPTPTHGWLAQVIYAWLYDLGGWRAVQILHATLFAAAFGIAGLTASHQLIQGRYPVLFSLITGVSLGVIAGLSNADLRPQSFALLAFAAVLYLVRHRPFTGRSLAGIAVIAILWQNTHPSLSVGILAVGAMAAGEWLTKWRHPDQPAPLFLTLVTGVLALAQLATPMGWRIFEVSATNLHVARELLRISEWLPPWDPAVRFAMNGFFLSAAITLVLLITQRRRLQPADWLLLLAMSGLTLFAARFALFWGIALIPLWTQLLEGARPAHRFTWVEVPWRRGTVWLTGTGAMVAVYALPLLIQGQPQFRDPLTSCLGTLSTALPTGRIYNYREWGGPLILEGYPQWRISIDGRLFLYTDQDWDQYTNIAQGRMTLDDIVTRYGPDAFVLHPIYHKSLINILDASEQYRRLVHDELCVAYTHR